MLAYANSVKMLVIFLLIIFTEEGSSVTLPVEFEEIDIDKNATEMHLSYRNISEITNGIFIDMGSLNFLDLSRNGITTISNGSFMGTDISHLDLSHNELQEFPYLVELSDKLRVLKLTKNPIVHLPWQRLVLLEHLKELDLSDTALKIIPGDYENTENPSNLEIFRLNSLSDTLSTESNDHTSGFTSFANITQLFLNYGLPKLQNFLGIYTILENVQDTLEILHISNNAHVFRSQQWDVDLQLFRLNVIIMQTNELTSVPSFNQDIKLTLLKLDLSHNSIENIDKFMLEDYPLLTFLSLKNNALRTIPKLPNDTFHDHLSVLDLSQNFIGHQDDLTFKHFNSLSELNVSSNYIKDLPALSIFPRSIKVLDLGFNYIRCLNHASLSHLGFLNILKLQHNYLSEFPNINETWIHSLDLSYNIFQTFPNLFHLGAYLNSLYLKGNQINTLPRSLLEALSSLTDLDLSYNKLTYIPNVYDMQATSLTNLSIFNNPLHCNCRLTWLKENIQFQLDIKPSDKPCVFPKELSTVKWGMISKEQLALNCSIADAMNTDMKVDTWIAKEAPGICEIK